MHRISGIGEILWDVFPDGPRFGGAPANFCCSAAELGQQSVHVSVVSGIGNDKHGQEALKALAERNVDTSALQANDYDTGQVIVTLDETGIASYRFAEDSAWDHLTWTEVLQRTAATSDAVCFGTLGQRHQQSGRVIHQFLKATSEQSLRILDVNLRAPFFDDESIRQSLALANVLKLNEEELSVVASLCGCSGSEMEVMHQLARLYHFRCVALTRGSNGAAIIMEESVSDLPGNPVEVADTVGAGDAFTAAMTLGLLNQKRVDDINKSAIAAATCVCSQPGATMVFPDSLLLN